MKYLKTTDAEGNETFLLQAESEEEAEAACALIDTVSALQTQTEESATALMEMAETYDDVITPLSALAALLKTE